MAVVTESDVGAAEAESVAIAPGPKGVVMEGIPESVVAAVGAESVVVAVVSECVATALGPESVAEAFISKGIGATTSTKETVVVKIQIFSVFWIYATFNCIRMYHIKYCHRFIQRRIGK